ncbi:hypothetical protein F3I27_01365 [Pantoea sp. Bo_2]|uniref:Uncharacterized protein n=1 Tax=Candidatus Pantoea gossypiicola TaxID=2608008 RepID=A0AB34CPQ2_9GAMM|nr:MULTISPECIES: hypothetical protein [Pantoea]KAA5929621.1 hypothetical protein F3I58_20190 [Pantoea sp. VH_4]KAA5938887.1 hypothetical protein F3I57_19645 [Pantoea sp. VH_3]KAA5950811.1 hypothetical protein F3I55_21075 [Pantoea sp. VH_24]KAA5953024.1 hypothetical protein F3I56_08890 [Pantoea sp. VH_25]KAA5959476.1 hypothetical protein F3I53_12350 [Pantoea sp. VH_16]
MSKNKIAMNPWDFTLYECEDSSYVMKVMFSEGDYKVDVERFFIVTPYIGIHSIDIEMLKDLSKKIREGTGQYVIDEISKEDFELM